MPQSLSNVLVHFVFSTRNRFPFLSDRPIRRRMHGYIARVFNVHGSPAIEVGGTADHIHTLCSLGRRHAMSEIIREAKANSSRWAKTMGGIYLKFGWQGGYGAFSVHPSRIDEMRDYIGGQEEHHRTRSFQEEYLSFLREYHVPYDERYLWD